MRLINVNTHKLEEFVEGDIPPYAILSHRWTREELTFKEVAKDRVDENKSGYRKLVESCLITKRDHNLDYLWNDTCCIDKRSSAELSEAINSMCAWYRDAEVCLAYLEDVHAGDKYADSFGKSIWWTRAWTLQELLAPAEVMFYSVNWETLGTKRDNAKAIEQITGINERALLDWTMAQRCKIATKMSWAANRKATRTEDVAYSLMGIFGISMPLLYGEGAKAFTRLQREMIQQGLGEDLSILVWGIDKKQRNLLAHSPADFASSIVTPLLGRPVQLVNANPIGLEVYARVVRWSHNTYGIDLESYLDQEPMFMLVRARARGSQYIKIGFDKYYKPGSSRFLERGHKNLTILWDWNFDVLDPFSDSEYCLPEPEHWPRQGPGHIPFSISMPEDWAWSGPVRLHPSYSPCQCGYTGRRVRYRDDPGRLDFEIDLAAPCSDVGIVIMAGESLELCMGFTVDFDFDACIIFSRTRLEKPLLELAKSLPNPPDAVIDRRGMRSISERRMLDSSHTGGDSVFYRACSSSRRTFAQLPTYSWLGVLSGMWVFHECPNGLTKGWKMRFHHCRPF